MTLRDEFLSDHPIESELESMGVKLIGSGDDRKACCPFHEDKNPSLSVNVRDGSWKCFAGCGQGGVVELLSRHQGKTPQFILDTYKAQKNGGNHHLPEKQLPPLDWNACVDEFGEPHKKRLCEWRGLSPKFVEQLVEHKMVGICEGHLAFPIYAAGKVVGTHQRVGDSWIIRGGSGSPWVIGSHFENVIIFESQWDAFVLMDALKWFDTPAWQSSCSIVITRGAAKGRAIQNLFPTGGRITVWMQNDKPDARGNVASDKWLLDVVSVCRRVHVCRPPEDYKDLNDWYRDGFGLGSEFLDLMEKAQEWRDPNLPNLPTPIDLRKLMKFDSRNDPSCLIGSRYLCRGGSIMWVGASGLGKSVMTFQAAIHWSLGEPFLGMEPKRPLSSVIMGAEDDEGDLAETMQGVMRGMGIEDGSKKFDLVMERVILVQEIKLKGLPFIGMCQEVVAHYKSDLLWINPLLSYFVGNPSDPEKASEFTGALSSMQFETGVCTMLVHHTGKPKDGESTKGYSIDDYSYIGLGSSVWTNWVRAIIVLMARKEPKGVFVMKFAKRGQRVGIVNDDCEKLREVFIEHSKDGLCWLPSDFCPDEAENQTKGRPVKLLWSRVNESWDGMDKSTSELKAILRGVLSISDKSAFRAIDKWAGVYIIKNTKDLWVKI